MDNTKLNEIINKILSITETLLLKEIEFVYGSIQSAYFINFIQKELSEIRQNLVEIKYEIEKTEKLANDSEKTRIQELKLLVLNLYDFLYNEYFQNPKTFRVYHSFIDHNFLNQVRECRFHTLKLSRKFLNV